MVRPKPDCLLVFIALPKEATSKEMQPARNKIACSLSTPADFPSQGSQENTQGPEAFASPQGDPCAVSLILYITALYVTCSQTLLEPKGVLSCSLSLLCFLP